MELKHSFNLLTSRYTLVVKILLFYIIVTGIFAAILVSIMTPGMDPLFSAINDAGLIGVTIETGRDMFIGNITYADGMAIISTQYQSLLSIVDEYRDSLILFYVLASVVFFFYRLIVSMTSIPISDSINTYMESSMHKSLMGSFAENLWISLKYALCATIINSLLNAAFGYAVYYLVMATVVKWGFGSFSVGLLLLLILLSLKYALLLGWIPGIVVEKKKVLKAFVDSFKNTGKWFKTGFLCSFMLYLLVIPSIVIFGLATFLILVPFIIVSEMIMLRNIELVCYYNSNKLRYYIDRSTIIKPREELY